MSDKLPEPYYQDESCTIYCGDCREILPLLPKVDLVLTDPPYGINRSGQGATFCKNPKHNRKHHSDAGWDKCRPDRALIESLFTAADNQIIWGGNYFADMLPPSMGWIVWDKGQDFSTSDCELAFTSFNKALRRVVCNRGQIAIEGAHHPTQKPLEVILFCFAYADGDPKTILDPFMGSGTTLRAAKDLGRRAIGIEINEEYCRIAKERLRQEVFAL